MSDDIYEVHAIKYGWGPRRSPENFIAPDIHDQDMPLAYFVWAIVGNGRTIIVDTGFNAEAAQRRGRQMKRPVPEGLETIGIAPDSVDDVILTHLHYDHAGNTDLFRNACFHLQDAEMEFATGRCMCHGEIRHAFDVGDVTRMVEKVFEEKVQFHQGVDEIAPGVTVHHIGGHTKGLQAVRVRTRRGWVVLASDASHFYAHFEENRAFPVLFNHYEVLEGYRTLRALASSPAHIVPGHDPLVLQRYPALRDDTRDWVVRLDVEPAN